MRSATVFTTWALLASAIIAEPIPNKSPKPSGLWTSMCAKGRTFIGTALTIRSPEDAAEKAIISNSLDFNSVTPENAMKWDATEPEQDVYTFDAADAVVDFATKRGYQIHCHNLVWHSQLPTWVSAGNFTKDQLIEIMRKRIQTVAGRYKKVCTRWDVVNEALNENGTYRSSVFYDTIGESFIPLAFSFARKYSPNSHLFYNDYNLETNNDKTAGARRIVKLIQSYAAKTKTHLIDGVGFQAHLSSEVTPTSEAPAPSLEVLESALQSITGLGVDVAYTELDVRMNTPATPAKLEVQKKVYERVARSCLNTKRCVGMTVWGVSDKYSWIPGTFPGEGAALMWDENYKKKPAYAGFKKGIDG